MEARIEDMRARLNAILSARAHKRVNGKVASNNTTATKGKTLHTCFNDLWEIGYKVNEPANLNVKHITALCEHWHANDIAVSTMQARLSVLRIFADWIGKPGMVGPLAKYLPAVDPGLLKVRRAAFNSKSWTDNDIDVIAKIKGADAQDARFGLMLRVELAFGLRRMEVLQFKPHKSDKGSLIRIYEAKNGRQRDIDISMPEQRAILDMARAEVCVGDALGWKLTLRGEPANMEYNLGRYNRCMAAIGITRKDAGVTGHGLRAQYAENAALLMQMIPPTLGGTGGQMDKDSLHVKRAQVSELLGHSRVSITPAYYGSFGRSAKQDESDRCRKNIEHCLKYLHDGVTGAVDAGRRANCLQLLDEMENIGVVMNMRQAQALWEVHSERHGHAWIKPGPSNAIPMETAAIRITKQMEKEDKASGVISIFSGT